MIKHITETVRGWATVTFEDGTVKKMRGNELDNAKFKFAATQSGLAIEGDDPVVESDGKTRKIGNRTVDVSKYERTKGSMDCADPVALSLRGSTLDDVYAIASEATGYPVDELRQKYAHLNLGMQRMCLGNLIRRNK